MGIADTAGICITKAMNRPLTGGTVEAAAKPWLISNLPLPACHLILQYREWLKLLTIYACRGGGGGLDNHPPPPPPANDDLIYEQPLTNTNYKYK